MVTDDVHVCATLRNIEADFEYLHFRDSSFGDFWIEKLSAGGKNRLCRDLAKFTNFPGDKYLVARSYYIGRGKSSTVLADNERAFFFPLFRVLKLFKRGDLIMPIGFYRWKDRWHEARFQGENYGFGYGLKGDTYRFRKADTEPFKLFCEEIKTYLKHVDFQTMPYRRKPDMLKSIDLRCCLALHLFLKASIENNNPYAIIDRMIDCTIGLESLYLRDRESKRESLSRRIAALLASDQQTAIICKEVVGRFYKIRSAIVHGSGLHQEDDEFLSAHIYEYVDYLRRSILAFLDLNLIDPSKNEVLRLIDDHSGSTKSKRSLQSSLKLLQLAK